MEPKATAWLALALGLLAACATLPRMVAPAGMRALNPRMVLLPGAYDPDRGDGQPDGNSILIRAPDGLVVFDTGRHEQAFTGRIIDAAERWNVPVAAIVNSHWHLDHVSGNVPLREKYPRAKVYASTAIEDAMAHFLADSRRSAVARLATLAPDSAEAGYLRAGIARIDAGPKLFPTDPVLSSGPLRIAGMRFRVGLEENAVSGGDVWLLDPSTRTLLSGDLVNLPAPFFDTACPHGWSEALGRLDAQPFDTLVPGHGAPMTHAQFATYRRAFDDLLACAASGATVAGCAASWERDLGPLLPPDQRGLSRLLLDYYFQSVLRAEPAKRDKYCRAG
jgi:glyoxylase-like metal-dependent hydrolase (beta-lactamase superfamily II)